MSCAGTTPKKKPPQTITDKPEREADLGLTDNRPRSACSTDSKMHDNSLLNQDNLSSNTGNDEPATPEPSPLVLEPTTPLSDLVSRALEDQTDTSAGVAALEDIPFVDDEDDINETLSEVNSLSIALNLCLLVKKVIRMFTAHRV